MALKPTLVADWIDTKPARAYNINFTHRSELNGKGCYQSNANEC